MRVMEEFVLYPHLHSKSSELFEPGTSSKRARRFASALCCLRFHRNLEKKPTKIWQISPWIGGPKKPWLIGPTVFTATAERAHSFVRPLRCCFVVL